MNVVDCNDRVQCDRRPCLNGARCVDVSPTEYRCECPRKFTGKIGFLQIWQNFGTYIHISLDP